MDYEDLLTSKSKRPKKYKSQRDAPDDLGNMCGSMVQNVNFKLAIFIFAIYILLNTTIFIEKILSRFNNAVDTGSYPSESGIIIQAGLLAMCYIIIDLFVKGGLV